MTFQVPSLDVAVPMHLKSQRMRRNSLTEESDNLKFVIMLKKGSKQHFKSKGREEVMLLSLRPSLSNRVAPPDLTGPYEM